MANLGTLWDRRRLAVFLPLVAIHVALLLTHDLAARLPLTLPLLAGGPLLLWLAVRRLERVSLATATVLSGAVILRLLLLPLPPSLSDDIHRYLWDGKVAAAGQNPYRWSPDSSELADLRDRNWEGLPHKEVATVYPPLALTAFVFAGKLPLSMVVLKGLLVLADLGTCGLLLGLADRRGIDRSRVLWYAWNPLVAVEVAGMGHVDALGVLASVATVAVLAAPTSRKAFTSAVAACLAGAAVLAKVVPLLAWPVWVRMSSNRALFAGLASGVLLVCGLPVVIATGGLPPGFIRFGVSWEFNGPLFEPLWRGVAIFEIPLVLERALGSAKALTGTHDFWNRLYQFNYPQLIAKGLLAIASIPFFWQAWRLRSGYRATGAVFSVLLLFSSTVYPWYLLWILPWAALDRRPAWLLLGALLPLSYLPQFHEVELFPALFCAIWAPFALVLWLERRWFAS